MKMKIAISRIQQMECYLDKVLYAMDNCPEAISEDEEIMHALQELMHYYDDGRWLKDYEFDEQGLLPKDLKRGVLAQDTLYDVLEQVEKMRLGEVPWQEVRGFPLTR